MDHPEVSSVHTSCWQELVLEWHCVGFDHTHFLGFMGTGELGITARKPVEDQTFGPVRGSARSEVEGQR